MSLRSCGCAVLLVGLEGGAASGVAGGAGTLRGGSLSGEGAGRAGGGGSRAALRSAPQLSRSSAPYRTAVVTASHCGQAGERHHAVGRRLVVSTVQGAAGAWPGEGLPRGIVVDS